MFKIRHSKAVVAGCLLWAALGAGCSVSKDDDDTAGAIRDDELGGDETTDSDRGNDAGGVHTPGNPTPVPANTEGPIGPLPGQGTEEPGDGGSTGASCASASSDAELQELALAFAFDVSGSMGEGDKPYHNKELKWDPVVAASRAFLESDDIVRVSASMVFFPVDDRETRCESAEYATPDVPLQPLPSTAFGEAIDEIFPDRGGTPTLAVVEATIAYVRGLIANGSTAKHAIVLVTDGMPQGCSEEETDSIADVAVAVADVADEVPVYVIGIENPVTEEEPNPPDNVTSLHQIAASGGTSTAFLIDTGDPTKTITDFDEVIQSIRSTGLSCELQIPPPPAGKVFDKDNVNVTLNADGEATPLIYSEYCSEEGAWHFDDISQPTRIVLCDDTCEVTKALADVALQVEFGCERRTMVTR